MDLRKLNRNSINNDFNAPERIIQFGEGNFLRAFADWMIDIMNEMSVFNGKIVLVQPIEKGLCELINSQQGLYHVFCRGYNKGEYTEDVRLIKAVERCIDPYKDPSSYVELAKKDSLDIIISNTTESGIRFDENNKLEDAPASSFPGKLTQLMYARFKYYNGDINKGYTILPCELIENNADALKLTVLKYAEHWDLGSDFIDWVVNHNYFHNTLVDRIVPGFPTADANDLKSKIGYDDNLMVAAEYFHLWVIEGDNNLDAKIPFSKSGLNVKLVENLKPYRERKVKVLNASHTAMTPISLLYGNTTVRQTIEMDFTRTFVEDLVYGEILPTLNMDEKEKRQFAGEVIERFKNPSINHLLGSIALNSISKFKVRNLPSLLDYLSLNEKLPTNLTFAMSSLFIMYKGEFNGKTMPVNDDASVLDFFKKIWNNGESYSTISKSILENKTFWDQDLSRITGLVETIAKYLEAIENYGIEEGYNLSFMTEENLEVQ